MAARLVRRLPRLCAVLLLVTLSTTLLLDLLGDPERAIAGEYADAEVLEAVRQRYHLDDSVLERYVTWVGHAVRLDLGESFHTNQPVFATIRQRLPVTLELALLATAIALAVSVPLALYTASHAGSRVDRVVNLVSSSFIAAPIFLTSILLIYVFGVRLQLAPISGWVPLTQDPVQNLRHAILPAVALSITEIVVLQRVLRADVRQTLSQDFVTSAVARGLSPARIMARHVLRPSSFSILTLAGLSLGRMIGGSVVVETIFALPGLGRLMINAIQGSDIIMIQGIVAFVAVTTVLMNLVVDLVYFWLDPRVRDA